MISPAFGAMPGAFAVIGAGLMFLGARNRRAERSLRQNGVRVPGLVTRIELVDSGDLYQHHPVLRFRTLNGREVETRGWERCEARAAFPGQPVTVLYDPQNPAMAVALEIPSRPRRGIGIVGLGAMFLTIGLILLAFWLLLP